jgi:hypothetical protein
MLNLGQVTSGHLTQVQHSPVSAINLTNSSAQCTMHHDMVSFSFLFFVLFTDSFTILVSAAMTTQGISGHCPLPPHLQFAPCSPSQPACESAKKIFFFLTNVLFAYCSLPPSLAVSTPPPLCVDSLPCVDAPPLTPHRPPPPLMSRRPLPPLASH